jgi:Mn-dependent DtxR family transcriptional regulator
MKNPELDKAISVVRQAVTELVQDGILTVDENGLTLTPEGEAWVEIKHRYQKEQYLNLKGRSKR